MKIDGGSSKAAAFAVKKLQFCVDKQNTVVDGSMTYGNVALALLLLTLCAMKVSIAFGARMQHT